MIESTQRKMPRLIIQTKRIQKDRETKRRDQPEKTLTIWVALEMKVKMDKAQTHKDRNSDISFEDDTDEEIDTTVIEEEDWIDY